MSNQQQQQQKPPTDSPTQNEQEILRQRQNKQLQTIAQMENEADKHLPTQLQKLKQKQLAHYKVS